MTPRCTRLCGARRMWGESCQNDLLVLPLRHSIDTFTTYESCLLTLPENKYTIAKNKLSRQTSVIRPLSTVSTATVTLLTTLR